MAVLSRNFEEATHVSAILVNPNQQIPLVLQKVNGEWSLPKGRIEEEDWHAAEADPTLVDDRVAAAEREVREETGLKRAEFVIVDALGVAVRSSVGRGRNIPYLYFAGTTSSTSAEGLLPLNPDEIGDVDLFDLDMACSMLPNPIDAQVIQDSYFDLRGLTPGIFAAITEGYDSNA